MSDLIFAIGLHNVYELFLALLLGCLFDLVCHDVFHSNVKSYQLNSLNAAQKITNALNEISGGEDGEGGGTGMEVFDIVGGKELAVVFDGGGEDGQIFGIGETGKGVDFLRSGVGEDLQTAADEHAKGDQRGRKFLLEIALDFGDNLLAGDGFDEGDFCHTQDDEAGAVLLGGG